VGSVTAVPYVLAAWTLLVWATRIRNILEDDAAWGPGRVVDLALAVALVGLAAAVVLWARRGRPVGAVPALVVGTVAVWAVRAPGILLDGRWSVGFKVVHTLLAVVSVALAAATWRWWRAHRAAAAPPARARPV
jgi:hypothetical protein